MDERIISSETVDAEEVSLKLVCYHRPFHNILDKTK